MPSVRTQQTSSLSQATVKPFIPTGQSKIKRKQKQRGERENCYTVFLPKIPIILCLFFFFIYVAQDFAGELELQSTSFPLTSHSTNFSSPFWPPKRQKYFRRAVSRNFTKASCRRRFAKPSAKYRWQNIAGSSTGTSFFMQKEYFQAKIDTQVSSVMYTSDKYGVEDRRSGTGHTSTEIICFSSVNLITLAVRWISDRGNIHLYFFRIKSIKQIWKTRYKSHTLLSIFVSLKHLLLYIFYCFNTGNWSISKWNKCCTPNCLIFIRCTCVLRIQINSSIKVSKEPLQILQ